MNSTYKYQETAMETRCAPNYAIIFMAELEEEFLSTLTLKPRIWKRFIDDIFIIWNYGEEELGHLLTLFNQFHPTIKFILTANTRLQEVVWFWEDKEEIHKGGWNKPKKPEEQRIHQWWHL